MAVALALQAGVVGPAIGEDRQDRQPPPLVGASQPPLPGGPVSHVQPVGAAAQPGKLTTPPPALPRPPRRIVSLAPHLTELVFAAGGGDRLVGVGRHSDHPPAARKLPVVGDAFAVNLEAIAALQPDLILAWESGMPPRQRQRLHGLGVPVWTSEIRSVEEVAATLVALGRLLGTPEGQAEADRLRRRWAALQTRYTGRAPARVFYQLWGAPLMTVSDAHLIGTALRACGGVNPFGRLRPLTPTVSWEAAVAADPQVVVGAESARGEMQRAWSRFPQVQAVRQRAVVGLPGDGLARMGPRFLDGAEALCAAIDAARRSDPLSGAASAPGGNQATQATSTP